MAKKLPALKISNILFSLFLAGFVFPIRKVIYENSAFETGLFSEFSAIFFEISEIFLAGVFLFFAIAILKKEIKPEINERMQKILLLGLLILLSGEIAVFFSEDRKLAFYGLLKITEIFAIAFYVAAAKVRMSRLVKILLLVAIFQGILAIAQFMMGQSAGFSFLGEQPMNVNLPGAPKIEIDGKSYLRATGTFLHPNILAAFLLFVFFLAEKSEKNWRNLRWLLIFPLLLTFSREAILAFLVGSLVASNLRKQIWKVLILFAFAVLVLVLIFPDLKDIFISRLTLDNSFYERRDLLNISFDFLKNNPFGFGVKNFVLHLSEANLPLQVWQMQPVHNIFLLTANQMGILAAISMIAIFAYSFLKSTKMRPILATFLVFALFDHFLISIYAGLVMLALTFGLGSFKQEEVIAD